MDKIKSDEIVVMEYYGDRHVLRCKTSSLNTCGTCLKAKVLEICDSLQLPCTLMIVPDDSDTTYDALCDFYASFEFSLTKRHMQGRQLYMRPLSGK